MGAKLIAPGTTGSREGRGVWVVVGVLALLFVAREASAQTRRGPAAEAEPQAFRVVFSSSSACSNPSEFVEQLQGRTGHLRPANMFEPALTFFVGLTITQAGVQGYLRVQNPDGTSSAREVPGVDCHEVISAMALIGALTVDPFALTSEVLPPPPPPSPPPGPPQPDTPKVQRGWSLGAGQRLNVNGGVLPGLGWGESLFVEAAFPVTGVFHPSLRLAGHFAQTAEETQLAPPLGTGDFEWTAARLAACPVLWAPKRWLSLRPCVFVDAGQLFARGVKTPNPHKYYLFWTAAGLELELEVRLVGPLTLGAEAGLMQPLGKPNEFHFVPSGSPEAHIHQTSRGLSAGLGLGLRFF